MAIRARGARWCAALGAATRDGYVFVRMVSSNVAPYLSLHGVPWPRAARHDRPDEDSVVVPADRACQHHVNPWRRPSGRIFLTDRASLFRNAD